MGACTSQQAPRTSSATAPETPLHFDPYSTFSQKSRIGCGEVWPNGYLYEPWPVDARPPEDTVDFVRGKPVEIQQLVSGKRTVLLGMPGAFTPNCTRVHLPQYVEHAPDFYAAGVDQILVMVPNDVTVVKAWDDMLGASTARIRVLSDRCCDVALVRWPACGSHFDLTYPCFQSVGLALDARMVIGRITIHRFCALLDDGVVKVLMAEPGGLGLSCSLVRDGGGMLFGGEMVMQ